MNVIVNKNILPNLIALLIIAISFLFNDPIRPVLLSVGLFALSGALTNWLAVHMLFERVPGLYGSGVIVLHFEQFKEGIMRMVHEHLFNQERVEKVFNDPEGDLSIDLKPLISGVDLDVAYDQLVETVMESSFGSMLGMLGGESALDSMREPFKRRMSKYLEDVAGSPKFQKIVSKQLSSVTSSEQFMTRLDKILRTRLDELTPEMVRDIMQQMIRKHLGWLVVWGGVFGGLIGLITGLFTNFL